MEVNMPILRKILLIVGFLLLTACSVPPENTPVESAQVGEPESAKAETPSPSPIIAKSVSLGESVPVAVWTDKSQEDSLVPIDPHTGQVLPDYEPIPLGQSSYQAFSPDQHTLAVVGFVSGQHPNGGSLHMINLNTWKEKVQELQLDSYVNAMAFSPDGRQLAIAYGNAQSHVLILYGNPPVTSKTAIRETALDFYVYSMKFKSDGSGLMIYGSKIENRYTVNETSPDPPVAVLLDNADLSVRWKANLDGVHDGILSKDGNVVATPDLTQPGSAIYLYPGLAFAPDSNILYVVHADEDRLTVVDFAAQKVTTLNIKPQLSWIGRLLSLGAIDAYAKVAEGTRKSAVISPDGKFLYIVGQRSELTGTSGNEIQMNNIPLGLQIVRTSDGSRVAHYDTDAQELSISADGRYVYLRSWGVSPDIAVTQIFDTSSDRIISSLNGMFLMPTRRINGTPILGSSVWVNDKGINHNAIVDPQNLAVTTKWDSTDTPNWLPTP
jgi:DNA-binding beta-propeller fold protein YncE